MRVSRRRFVGGAGGLAAAAVLAGCTGGGDMTHEGGMSLTY